MADSQKNTKKPQKGTRTKAPSKASSIADKILLRKKDPELQRRLQSEQLDFEATAENEIDDAIATSALKVKTDLKRKKRKKYSGIALAIAVVGYLGYGLFAPRQIGLNYGVCKIFLELDTRYPQTLKLSGVDELNSFTRIWHTKVDAFGQYRFEDIECTFAADEKLGARLSSVTYNRKRREADPERIEAFNRILPIILANPPNLDYPAPIPDSLKDLKIETHLFRRPIL